MVEARLLLNAFAAYAEEHIAGVQRTLHVLATTREARAGRWDAMQGMLAAFDNSGINPAAVWFARPDGAYYAVGKGLTGENLRDRTYFPSLMAGKDVVGDLVISKSTGKRSAIVAVPVKRDGKVTGALGATLSVEEISRMIEEKLGMPRRLVFYALDAKGRTALHRAPQLLLAFPSDMGSATLSEAVTEMLTKSEGVVRYEFQGKKTVVFKRAPLTGWVFALGLIIDYGGG